MNRIFGLLAVYYAIGIVAIAVINRRKKDADVNARWTKLGVYLVITLSLTAALCFAPWLAIGAAMLIAIIGLYELARLPCLARPERLLILAAYCVAATLFCLFVARSLTGKMPCIIYLLVLSFDGFSQIFGQLIGGRRLAPRVSPGKTYSGLTGGLLMGVVTAAFLKATCAPRFLLSAMAVCLLAFTGDMLASAIKRRAGVKDYSALIPGHGGVLDRFDSFLFVGAALECYFRLV